MDASVDADVAELNELAQRMTATFNILEHRADELIAQNAELKLSVDVLRRSQRKLKLDGKEAAADCARLETNLEALRLLTKSLRAEARRLKQGSDDARASHAAAVAYLEEDVACATRELEFYRGQARDAVAAVSKLEKEVEAANALVEALRRDVREAREEGRVVRGEHAVMVEMVERVQGGRDAAVKMFEA